MPYGTIGVENNGIYDIVSANGLCSLAIVDGELAEGTFQVYTTFGICATANKNKNGIVFGGTGLANIVSNGEFSKQKLYYWYFNYDSGAWILYKGDGTGLKQLNTNTGWACEDPFVKGNTYLLEVTLEKEDTGLRIILKVDGEEFFNYLDTDPHTGTELGLRIADNACVVSWYGMKVTPAGTAAEAAAQNSFNAVADLPRKD